MIGNVCKEAAQLEVLMLCQAFKVQMFWNTAVKCVSKHPGHMATASWSFGVFNPSFDRWLTCCFQVWLTLCRTNLMTPHTPRKPITFYKIGKTKESTDSCGIFLTVGLVKPTEYTQHNCWCHCRGQKITVVAKRHDSLVFWQEVVLYSHTFISWQKKNTNTMYAHNKSATWMDFFGEVTYKNRSWFSLKATKKPNFWIKIFS